MVETARSGADLSLMDGVDLLSPDQVEAQLVALARRHRAASGGAMALVNALGTRAENALDRLPVPVRTGLDSATRQALEQAIKLASASRTRVPDQPDWVNSALGGLMGAVGGFGGAPTALAELPATVTLLLRVIQGVAQEHGFDPDEASVRFDCLKVFGSAGPLAVDDGAETAFVAARLSLNGAALNRILQTVAPRLAAALGQKLAAQSVPVLGAAAGAAINYAYVNYYRDMAHVSFGLRRLAVEAGVNERDMIARFAALAGRRDDALS